MRKKKWIKRGLIYKAEKVNDWWLSHTMAPAAILYKKNIIRIFLGCWDNEGISRIGYIDVDSNDPSNVLQLAERPVVDVGVAGTFDDNGVFPGHVFINSGLVFIYYTGFQLSDKVDHFNFSGLAISRDGGDVFNKYSQAPILDRSDEGLHVRAGLSALYEGQKFHCVYSSGTGFIEVGSKKRPIYEVYYQQSNDGIIFSNKGKKIVELKKEMEHGLGRPQIIKIQNLYYIFYTRRMLNMQYHIGCAVSKDLIDWKRCDGWITIQHGKEGEFDSSMVYFPCILEANDKTYMFYSGNCYGRDGLGYAELVG